MEWRELKKTYLRPVGNGVGGGESQKKTKRMMESRRRGEKQMSDTEQCDTVLLMKGAHLCLVPLQWLAVSLPDARHFVATKVGHRKQISWQREDEVSYTRAETNVDIFSLNSSAIDPLLFLLMSVSLKCIESQTVSLLACLEKQKSMVHKACT